MRATTRLLQHACRITLFTRQNCSLCTTAKETLSQVWNTTPFEYKEIDVMAPDTKRWRDLYEFDTPVVHISNSKQPGEDPNLSSKSRKLMHKFTAEQVHEQMHAVTDD